MTTNKKVELPSPPTFSQMMEDLEIMSADEKTFQLSQLHQMVNQSLSNETTNGNKVEDTYKLVNGFLARLETLKRLEKSLTNDTETTNDQLEKKLKDIIEQLQMCLNKLQTNSFSDNRKKLSDNKN